MNTSFYSGGAKLSAVLHEGAVESGQRRGAGVVVVGSWVTVKEQMPAQYAPLLSKAGIHALTFDYRGFGASEGAPREVESGRAKAEDILNAAAHLATLPQVDPARVGVLAICASSAYVALALQGAKARESAIKSVAMVAPWLHDREIAEQLYGGKEGIAKRLEQARRARETYSRSGEVTYVKAASNTDPGAAMYFEGDALDYYLNPKRGAIKQWGGKFAVMGWTEWLQSDWIALADRFEIPLRIVTSEQSATPAGAKQFVERLRGKHDEVWTEGTQFHFYDDPATVRFAADRAIEHFNQTLS